MASTDKQFVSPAVRCGYVNVFRPRMNMNNNREEYSLQMILHKERDKAFIKKVEASIDEILEKVYAGKRVPKDVWRPLVDAAEYHEEKGKALPEYLVDCYTMNVKNVDKPGLVDKDRDEVIDANEFQSGDYARVNFNLFGYSKGSGGVSASLQNVQVVKKGESLASRARPQDVFTDFEDSEEEEDIYA